MLAALVAAALVLAPSAAHAAAPTRTFGIDPEPPSTKTAHAVILGGFITDSTFTALQAVWWLRTGKANKSFAAMQLVSSGLIFAYSASLLRREGSDAVLIGLDVWTALLCTQSAFTLFGGQELIPPLDREHDLRLGASLVGGSSPGLGVTGTW